MIQSSESKRDHVQNNLYVYRQVQYTKLRSWPSLHPHPNASRRLIIVQSNVEQELHHIAFGDDIILPLTAQPTLVAGFSQ